MHYICQFGFSLHTSETMCLIPNIPMLSWRGHSIHVQYGQAQNARKINWTSEDRVIPVIINLAEQVKMKMYCSEHITKAYILQNTHQRNIDEMKI